MARLPTASGMIEPSENASSALRGLCCGPQLMGLSFSIPELLIVSAWAEFHELRLVVELDTCVEGVEYEEIMALYAPGESLRRWTLWRARDGVVLEPRRGPALRAECISTLLPTMIPELA